MEFKRVLRQSDLGSSLQCESCFVAVNGLFVSPDRPLVPIESGLEVVQLKSRSETPSTSDQRLLVGGSPAFEVPLPLGVLAARLLVLGMQLREPLLTPT